MTAEQPRVDGRTLRFQDRRPRLLDAVTEYVLDHGASDLSLRPLAVAVGVTHATLLRHFASKEQLLREVAQHLRGRFEDELAAATELTRDASATDLARAIWTTLCDPIQQRQFLLLFELAGRRVDGAESTLHGSAASHALAAPMVHDWVRLLADRLTDAGWTDSDALTLATLLLAQARGLQLDLLITGDKGRVDAAFEISLRLLAPQP
jgi:AcrR family transcriptional regulator